MTEGRLRSRVNDRSFAIGELELPTLAGLRARALLVADRVRGRLSLMNVSGDVGVMHRDLGNRGALFQVASQFNLLEMIGLTLYNVKAASLDVQKAIGTVTLRSLAASCSLLVAPESLSIGPLLRRLNSNARFLSADIKHVHGTMRNAVIRELRLLSMVYASRRTSRRRRKSWTIGRSSDRAAAYDGHLRIAQGPNRGSNAAATLVRVKALAEQPLDGLLQALTGRRDTRLLVRKPFHILRQLCCPID